MNRPLTSRFLLISVLLLAVLFTGCSHEANARTQKYFDSGEDLFANGKYSEAAAQYSEAIKIDSNFVQAHYKLGQTYIRLRDLKDASDELNRTIALDPTNYRAHTDLANLLIASRNPDSLKDAKIHLDLPPRQGAQCSRNARGLGQL